MKNNFESANKCLTDEPIKVKHVGNCKPWDNVVNIFNVNRAKFCNALQNDGYSTFTIGNYITAKRGDECNTFFFSSHNSWNHNYLIPNVLANRVQYFVFYDNAQNLAYIVGYGKVREYANTIKTGYKFYDSDTKLFIPDEWASNQKLNTYDCTSVNA